MKNLFLSVLILPGLLFGMHHEKNPIIFYLDLEMSLKFWKNGKALIKM